MQIAHNKKSLRYKSTTLISQEKNRCKNNWFAQSQIIYLKKLCQLLWPPGQSLRQATLNPMKAWLSSMYNNLNINVYRDFKIGQCHYILEYLNCLGKVLQFFWPVPNRWNLMFFLELLSIRYNCDLLVYHKYLAMLLIQDSFNTWEKYTQVYSTPSVIIKLYLTPQRADRKHSVLCRHFTSLIHHG